MGLFKKKEDVPSIAPTLSPSSLPPLPSLPEVEKETTKKNLPELPSFPTSPENDNINQEMVRSAVSDVQSPEESKMYENASKTTIQEPKIDSAIPSLPSMEKASTPDSLPISEKNFQPPTASIASIPSMPMAPSIPTTPSATPVSSIPSPNTITPTPKQNDPIFIRIDKFQAAQKNFENIKNGVTEIEAVLKKIKDIKSQEENELKGWTEDIEKLKIGLAEIDNDIFSQL